MNCWPMHIFVFPIGQYLSGAMNGGKTEQGRTDEPLCINCLRGTRERSTITRTRRPYDSVICRLSFWSHAATKNNKQLQWSHPIRIRTANMVANKKWSTFFWTFKKRKTIMWQWLNQRNVFPNTHENVQKVRIETVQKSCKTCQKQHRCIPKDCQRSNFFPSLQTISPISSRKFRSFPIVMLCSENRAKSKPRHHAIDLTCCHTWHVCINPTPLLLFCNNSQFNGVFIISARKCLRFSNILSPSKTCLQ